MAAVMGRNAGFIASVYRATKLSSLTDTAGITAFFVTANKIPDVRGVPSISKERAIIDIPVAGADTAGKLPGQVDPGTLDFDITMNFANTTHHTFIRDDAGTAEFTWGVEWVSGSDRTRVVMNGFIGNATLNAEIEDATIMNVSVARSGAAAWSNNT